MQQPKKIIPRTMAGLRDALFDTLEKLRDGDMLATDAREMASVARVIIESVEVQVTFEQGKAQDKLPQHLPDMHVVPPITQVLESKDAGKHR